jgi:amino acid adenylation domain-containing protein/non-ribosomal peptide synthase protein (TIGR01720 family)
MLIKAYTLYKLIFDKFKFELHTDGLHVSPPFHIKDDDKVLAKAFIVNNKDFILSVLRENPDTQNILKLSMIKDFIPLSFAQERLWFIDKYESGTNAYNVPMIFKIDFEAREDLLEKSIRTIVGRHEVLRTLIREDGAGVGYQCVREDREHPLEINKTRVVQEFLEEALNQASNYVYDLSNEYPIRVNFYEVLGNGERTEEEKRVRERYISIVVHHIAFDGWSTDLFLKELEVCYRYYIDLELGIETSLDLPRLSIQYKDFALWQRSYLEKERLEKELSYWRDKLNGYETLNLVTDQVRRILIDYRGAELYFEMDEDLSRTLRALAKELKVSLYSVLLSGYYLLLRVYSNQDDIVIGTPIANRQLGQLEPLIGLFVNTLALRMKIDAKAVLREFIEEVGQEVVKAQLHQDLPFEKLVEELKIPKDTSRHPIFQVMFGMQSFGDVSSLSGILEPYSESNFYQIAKFDISTFIDDSEERLSGIFNYAVGLYREETIAGFVESYLEILKQIAESHQETQKMISDLEYLSESQYKKVIYDWNVTEKCYPQDKTIHQLFEEQVERTPNNIAVIYEGVKLTYKELNERTNQLAHVLRSYKIIKPDTLIVLCLDRSEHMLIAILGVLKAGGAYVPIDPNYPDERIAYVLEDTRTEIILGNSIYLQRLKEISKKICGNTISSIISIDDKEFQTVLDGHSKENLGKTIQATQLAYVIYTSGTTGKPKGVMIEHRGVINRIKWMNDNFPLGSNDKILQKTSYTFDVSVWELLWANWYGACLVFSKPEGHRDPKYILDLMQKENITVTHFVPSMFNMFLEVLKENVQKNNHLLSKMKYIFCSGEVLYLAQIQQFYSMVSHIEIHNLYGPTEATVDVLHYDCSDPCLTNVYIGKQIDNTKAYVLDPNLTPLPIGAIGELYVGGVALARGYLNQPELTAERFIENPFQGENDERLGKNGRLYKTGDLVRWLSDGNLEYIGRNDFQVKIRGYRIELGEIETILCSYEGIRQSVVLVKERTQSPETKYLVGYYVSSQKLNEEAILGYLGNLLPEYMIPHVLMHLEELPLTINGKLDRKSLPELNLIDTVSYIAPRNELEQRVCQIWAEVLGLGKDKIGIREDFFRLGGDSIVSIQLVSRLRQRLGLNIKIKDIFYHKTIEKLYDNVLSKVNNTVLDTISEQGLLSGKLALLPIQVWFFKNNFAKRHYWNQSFLVKVPSLNISCLQDSIDKLVAHHDAFRLRYREARETRYIQYYDTGYKPEKIKTLDLHKLSIKEGTPEFEEYLQWILTEWQSSFNLKSGPTYSIGYIYGYQDGSARIYFALHHLIVDTVSWRILIEDCRALYYEEKLGAKGSSYRQWVNVINEYGKNHQAQRDYWLDIVSDLKEIKINSKETHEELSISETSFSLSSTQTKALLQESNKAYHTEINDLLLTALGYALDSITGCSINHIALEGHGREDIDDRVDISRAMGWFTTMYPIRLEVKEELADSIKNTKEILRRIPDKGIGYGVLIGYEFPLPKICFNYLGQFDTVDNYWQLTAERAGDSIHYANKSENLININGWIVDNKLTFNIVVKAEEKVTLEFARIFREKLVEIIKYTTSQSRCYLTTSDVDYIVSQNYLDRLQAAQEIEGVYLANSLQQGFIYHALNQGEVDDAYRVQLLWEYQTILEADLLKEAWRYAQKQFSSLRLRLSWEEELVQVIDKEARLDWRYIDLSEMAIEEQRVQIEKIQAIDRSEGYDLKAGSLFRIHLIKQKDDLYTCLFSNHHAILDGWSSSILLNYVHQTYLKLNLGQEILLVKDKYGESQRYLQQHEKENQEYWVQYVSQLTERDNLNGILLPHLHDFRIYEYKHIVKPLEKIISIEGSQYEGLKFLSQSEGVTLNAILQYVWHKILNIYSGNSQTVMGTTVSGRNLPVNGIENLVGLYINTLPLIVEHQVERSIIESIKIVQDGIGEINSKSNISLAKLQNKGERLFNNLFIYENYPNTSSDAQHKLKINFIKGIEKLDYPLSIIAYEGKNEIVFCIKYAGELFDLDKIENIAVVVQLLLKQIIHNPRQMAHNLRYLTDLQYKNIIYDWNATEKNYSDDKTIHQLFEEQAERTPDNIAVVYKETKLTYKELNERANQLAHSLRSYQNIQPDSFVVLCLDRSEYMLIAILAILKAGGAYVPIDPHYPDERITYILNDTRAPIILSNFICQKRLKKLSKELDNSIRIILALDNEEFQSKLLRFPKENPEMATRSTHLAYVIYTSGTTSRPKGVMIEHGSVGNLIFSQSEKFELTKPKIFKQCLGYANYVFDAHVSEVYSCLLNGHTFHILDNLAKHSLEFIGAYIEENRISIATIPPVLLNNDHLLKLNILVVAGDKTKKSILDFYLNNQVKVINAYGPSEVTVCASLNLYEDNGANNIGLPIANVKCYVLDSYLTPLPIGAIGELYIGGVGLARGYLNQPELSAERFLENPFQDEKDRRLGRNERLYKTGDLVRWLPDGNLEYIGRYDFQVKIRGYRIELEEVETALCSYEGIKQGVVLAKERVGGLETKYLVGYYESPQKLKEKDILRHLESKLPEYMVPGVLVHLEQLPLTINGKLDRKSLPEPNLIDTEGYRGPRNELEQNVCQIWAEVLGLAGDKISIRDDFFRLGGDSIVGIQLISRLRQRLRLNIKIKDIFDYKTIEKLYDNALSKVSVNSALDTISEQGLLRGALDLLPIQTWFFKNNFAKMHHWNQSFLVKVPNLDISRLQDSINELVLYHDAFRLRYKETKETRYIQYYDAGYKSEKIKTLDLHKLDIKEGMPGFEEYLELVLTEWQNDFNLESGSLHSIGYIYGYHDGSARICFALHHLIVDTVSWRVLIEDLRILYYEKKLGAKGSSYRQWVNAINEYGKNHKAQRDYWLDILSDLKEIKINSKEIHKETPIIETSFSLSSTRTKALLQESDKVYHTEINDLLLTALGYALEAITGCSVNHIVLEGHGREEIKDRIDIGRTLGWFTTMYPVRLEVKKELSDSIKCTKEILRRIPDKGIGYGILMGYELPLPKICFNYLGQFDKADNYWQLTSEKAGNPIHIDNKSKNLININGLVIDNELHFNIVAKTEEKVTLEFTRIFREKLIEIIEHTINRRRSYLTTSDVDYIISQNYLDRLQNIKEIEGVYLANSLQQGFIYHALNQGEVDDAYRMQLLWEYQIVLEVDLLMEAWGYAQKRFSSLRLRLSWEEELVQVIDKEGRLDWRYIDLSGMALEEQKSRIGKIQESDRREGYDLSAGSLFRIHLIKQGDALYTCLFSNHHAILDGWSNSILLNYVHETYLKLKNKETLIVIEEHCYKNAQRYLQIHKDNNKNYWNEYLAHIEQGCNLSGLLTVNKGLNLSEYKHVKYPVKAQLVIEQAVYSALKKISQKEGVTLNAILQYVWHKILNVYSSNNQTIVGTTISGRNIPIDDIEESVGLYINTLPLIVQHENGSTNSVIDSIKTVQNNINEINGKSETCLAELQRKGQRLFDSIFVYENYPEIVSDENNKLKIVFNKTIEKLDYPLGVLVYESQEKIIFTINYAKEIFNNEIIDDLLLLVKNIINQIIENPHQPSRRLSYLGVDQYNQIVDTWNQTERSYSLDKTIQILFEEQVRKTPLNLALISDAVALTYEQLNSKANRIAHFLKEFYHIGPDSLIALCLDRSDSVLITMIGILKSGAAYVPLDPSYPDERIHYILNDTKTNLLLTSNNYFQRMNVINDNNITMLAIDDKLIQDKLSLQSTTNLKLDGTSNNLAYVIYTSGTTGSPKGVLIEHRSVVNYIFNVKDNSLILPEDKVDFSSNIGFDLTVTTTLCALCLGAQVIAYNNQLKNLELYIEHLIKEKINVVKLVPSYFELLIGRIQSTNINKIILGGEKLNASALNKMRDVNIEDPNTYNLMIYDEYGPTETTVGACISQINLNSVPNIGTPYFNYKIYVLDIYLKPIPVGAIGELYIGGEGLARGYLNQPALTAERFLTNPFQSEEDKKLRKNSRLYKTGDLGRWLPDGNLEYIGRNDHQVKIQGYRIELGEIESVLQKHGDVSQVIVIARNIGTSSRHQLVAYIVPGDFTPSITELKEFMFKKLPEYMIPSFFVFLESLPLTLNGKLDRNALPEIEIQNTIYTLPRNEIENRLCHIWADILGIAFERVGTQDDFFNLGGNSILAIKLANEINSYYHCHLKVSDIFAHKNIQSLWPSINQSKDNYKTLLKLNNTEQKINMFMIHPADAGCEVYTSLADALKGTFSCYGVDSYNLYNKNKIDNLNQLAKYYLSYIDKIMENSGQDTYHLLGWSLGGLISLEMAYILEERGDTKIRLYLLDSVLSDKSLDYFKNTLNFEDLKTEYRKYATFLGHDKSYIEKVILNMDVDEKLSKQTVSSPLVNTEALLFKAMLEDTRLKTNFSKKSFEYLSTLKYNNIDKTLKDSNIKLIKVENAHHGDILEQVELLTFEILRSLTLKSKDAIPIPANSKELDTIR